MLRLKHIRIKENYPNGKFPMKPRLAAALFVDYELPLRKRLINTHPFRNSPDAHYFEPS